MVAESDESSFVLVEAAVGVQLALVDEHAPDDLRSRWGSSIMKDLHLVNRIHLCGSGGVPHVGVWERHRLE
eukprot:286849-Prorocentrum_minimum.AAC.1